MTGIKIGRLFGIEVAIHPSWFVVLVFFAFALANGFFPNAYPGWSATATWAVAVAATLLLFVSVLAHEFGHSLVARSQGIPVRNITLFLLGGVAQLTREPDSPGREAWMAFAGPLVSIGVAAGALGAAYVLPGPEQLVALLAYLGVANAVLVVFNLLPGFPLDGGRVLRALLWRITRDRVRATTWAATVGQAFAAGFIALGAAQILLGGGLGGIWLIFIGWMMIQAARATAQQTVTEQRLDRRLRRAADDPDGDVGLALRDARLGRARASAGLGHALRAGSVGGSGRRIRRSRLYARPGTRGERALRPRPRARHHDAGAEAPHGHAGDRSRGRAAHDARAGDRPGGGRRRRRAHARLRRRGRLHAVPQRRARPAAPVAALYGNLTVTTAQSSASTPPAYSLTVSSRVSASGCASSGRLARTASSRRSSPKSTPSRRASVMPSV